MLLSRRALLPPSRSTTTPCSSYARSPEEANWDDTLAAVQRSARSTTSEPRWEPQLGSPVLPRPVLSRPLRRPSSATSLGLERLVEEAETALREVPVRRQERRPQPRRRHPFSDLLEMLPQETRMRPLSDIFDRLERPKLQSKQQERLREQPELKPDPKDRISTSTGLEVFLEVARRWYVLIRSNWADELVRADPDKASGRFRYLYRLRSYWAELFLEVKKMMLVDEMGLQASVVLL
ncbi:unnamed protein product [Effrenium voratum]|nr:unnamed protein product [Effrenium voratum]